jgi:succinate dehydrogenase / fumarate reductase, membrane anchor subunit
MDMRTPLAKVRGLGSARQGSQHFWLQRVTAVANVALAAYLVGLLVYLIGKDYAAVRAVLHNPVVATLMLLLVLSGIVHMRLGMQTIIEDYVHAEGAKVALLMLNTFFCAFVALIAILSVLKLSLGA